jgi:hypothetical protein
MPLLTDKLFITKDDFELYRDISEHMDADRVDASIREAQVTEFTDFIGQQLYLALQDDYDVGLNEFPTARLSTLFFGEDYAYRGKNVRYHGLQPMLTMFSYGRMLTNLQLSVTRGGPMTYTETDVSDPTTQAQIKTKVIDARSMALSYGAEVKQYLSQNRSVYPEYTHPNTETGFQMFKI